MSQRTLPRDIVSCARINVHHRLIYHEEVWGRYPLTTLITTNLQAFNVLSFPLTNRTWVQYTIRYVSPIAS